MQLWQATSSYIRSSYNVVLQNAERDPKHVFFWQFLKIPGGLKPNTLLESQKVLFFSIFIYSTYKNTDFTFIFSLALNPVTQIFYPNDSQIRTYLKSESFKDICP